MDYANFSTDSFIIETHFGVADHFIRAQTRNKYSSELVAYSKEVAELLFPDETFEVYFYPPEKGSYKDIVKFVRKHKVGVSVGTASVVIAAGSLIVNSLNYRDSHEEHERKMAIADVEDVQKCISLKEQMDKNSVELGFDPITEAKINKVCGSISLKKKKNAIYSALEDDSDVKYNEMVLTDSSSSPLVSAKALREDFSTYREVIPDQTFLIEGQRGQVELISPVLRQKKEGGGIPWRAIYYGQDIYYKEHLLVQDGTYVDFYMQDSEFKEQAEKREVTYATGDKMVLDFDIKVEIKGETVKAKTIYIKEVEKYNDTEILHKEKRPKVKKITQISQAGLFDEI